MIMWKHMNLLDSWSKKGVFEALHKTQEPQRKDKQIYSMKF